MPDSDDDVDVPDLTPDELAALLAQEPQTAEIFGEPVVTGDTRGDTLLPGLVKK